MIKQMNKCIRPLFLRSYGIRTLKVPFRMMSDENSLIPEEEEDERLPPWIIEDDYQPDINLEFDETGKLLIYTMDLQYKKPMIALYTGISFYSFYSLFFHYSTLPIYGKLFCFGILSGLVLGVRNTIKVNSTLIKRMYLLNDGKTLLVDTQFRVKDKVIRIKDINDKSLRLNYKQGAHDIRPLITDDFKGMIDLENDGLNYIFNRDLLEAILQGQEIDLEDYD